MIQNPHSTGFWLLMEVVYHSATVPHTHTHTHTHTPTKLFCFARRLLADVARFTS